MKTITIEELVDINLLEAFGLGDASEEQKREFTEKSTEVILERVVRRVADAMAPDARDKFYALFKDGVGDDERWGFIDKHIPNFEEIMLEELLKFKAEALEVAEEMKG